MIERDSSTDAGRARQNGDSSGASRTAESDASDVLALELDRLITDYFDAQREGLAPSVDDYVRAHPEHEHALRAVLPGASLLDRIGQRAEDAAPHSRSGERLGEFMLRGVLGRGGMGVVYDALQESLDRPVALKVLPASRVLDRKSRERFMREAQAAASLQHPGIVAVYGVGEADGQVYYAMQRIDGVPLDALTAAARGESVSSESTLVIERAVNLAARMRAEPLAGAGAAPARNIESASEEGQLAGGAWMTNATQIALQIAEALSYAHSRGVVHRDIKPSNVMLTGAGHAYVTDFGLCKVADTSSLTAAGDVVGTLRYVPPERFEGRDDARGDVYGLGLILYELLCGTAAFPQTERAQLVQAVTLSTPPRPRRLNHDIPVDLERIVLAATAKLPEERYASAEDLIEDLKAFLGGRPIRARAPGKLYLARLFLRRNRGLALTVLLSLVVLAIGSALYIRDLRRLVGDLEVARDGAERMAYHAQLGSAAQAIENERSSLARRFLDEVPPGMRDWLWQTLYVRLEGARLVVDEGAGAVVDAVIDPSGRRMAVLREGTVRIHDLADGGLLSELPSTGGRELAFVGETGALLVVEGQERAARVVLQPQTQPSAGLKAFTFALAELHVAGVESLDASNGHLALALDDGRVVVIPTGSPELSVVHWSEAGRDARLALFGDDGRVVYSVKGKGAWVLGPEEGRVRPLQHRKSQGLTALAGARDVPNFLALSGDGRLGIFVDDGVDGPLKAVGEVPVDGGSTRLALSPDGRSVVTLTWRGHARLWSVGKGPTRDRRPVLSSHPSVLLWPDGGDEIVLAGDGGEWRAVATPRYEQGMPAVSRSQGHFTQCVTLDVDPGGDWVAMGEMTGGWSIWDRERRLPLVGRTDELSPVRTLALLGGERAPRALALGGHGVRVWRPGGDALEQVAMGLGVIEVDWLGPDPNDGLLIVAEGGDVSVAQHKGGGRWRRDKVAWVQGPVTSADLRSGGADVLIGTSHGALYRVGLDARGRERPASPELIAELGVPIVHLAIGHMGRHVAVVTEDQQLTLIALDEDAPTTLWAVQAGEPGASNNALHSAAVDELDGWIVTVGADGWVRTWSLADGRPGPDLLRLRLVPRDVAFPSPGEPPVVVDFRGRLHFFEVDGTDRSGGAPGAEPTAREEAAIETLSARARLDAVEAALDRSPASRNDAWSLWQIAVGVQDHARRNRGGEVTIVRARKVVERAERVWREIRARGSE